MLETALRWCVWHSKLNVGGVDYSKIGQPERKGNDGIIIGVSSIKQLEGNLKDLEKGPLPEEVVKVLDEAWLISKRKSNTSQLEDNVALTSFLHSLHHTTTAL